MKESPQRFRILLTQDFDSTLVRRVEEVFHGENLIQAVIHGHLLLERAITSRIGKKLERPDILEDGAFGRWTFHQKLGLYFALYDPAEGRQRMLLGFNRLRNALSHRLDPEETAVATCLPWEGESPPPDARTHVWAIMATLFFELGILEKIEFLEPTEEEICIGVWESLK
jgi:hypothetical protein